MDEAIHPGLASEAGEPGRAGMVHQLKGLGSAFPQDANAVDQRIVAGKEGGQQRLVADPDVKRHDLPDVAQRLEILGRLGVAAADGNDFAACGEPLDDISADKA